VSLFTYIVSAIVGSLVGNFYEPAPFLDFVRSTIVASIGAIMLSSIALEIPEPIGNVFYCSFLLTTATAIAIAINTIGTMR